MPKHYKSPFESEMIMGVLSPEERAVLKKQWGKIKDQIGVATMWTDTDIPIEKIENAVNKHVEKYNEPDHYHEFELDTIEFLKRGFPPQVLTGFLIGNIIKYTQRFEYKNGEEDLVKVVDYAKRLQDWYKETHS